MKITLTVEMDVTPGTLTTEDEIATDAISGLQVTATGLGFTFGQVAYTVNSVNITSASPICNGGFGVPCVGHFL